VVLAATDSSHNYTKMIRNSLDRLEEEARELVLESESPKKQKKLSSNKLELKNMVVDSKNIKLFYYSHINVDSIEEDEELRI